MPAPLRPCAALAFLFALTAAGCSSEPPPKTNPYPPLPGSLDAFCRAPKEGVYAVACGASDNLVIADHTGVRLADWDGEKISPKELHQVFIPRLPDAQELNALSHRVPEAEILKKFGAPLHEETWKILAPSPGSLATGYNVTLFIAGDINETHYPDERRAEYELFTTTPHGEITCLKLHIAYPRDGADRTTRRVEWMMRGGKSAPAASNSR